MKKKLIKRNKRFFSKLMTRASGWPLTVVYYDFYSKQTVNETNYWRKVKRGAYSEESKRNGTYEMWTGRKPKLRGNK